MMKNTHFPLIVGNWKMHKTVFETEAFLQLLKPLVFRYKVGVWIAPSFTSIASAAHLAKGSPIKIGAQNMSELMAGALTGEVSAPMIIEAGAQFVILGHSERRRLFQESDAMINRKIKLALRSGLKVILCVGETKEEKEAGQTTEVLMKQLGGCLKDIPSESASQLIFAYEPVWAIGTTTPASTQIVEEIHQLCKNYVANYLGLNVRDCHILYGGSANGSNAKEFLKLPCVDGLLVGGASLDVKSFTEIIHQAEGIR